jgi:hypothetical protein
VPLGFGRPKSEDVVSLIAQKKYSQAIEVLRAQLKKRGASTTVRKQLADVLVLSGKKKEAVSLLIPLADQFAREGFAAKAVSILKRIEKIDPGRRDVDERLARLIVTRPFGGPEPEIGLEIGIKPPSSGSIDIPVPPSPPAEPAGSPAIGPARASGGAEIGFDLPAIAAPPSEAAAERPAAPPAEVPSSPGPDEGIVLPPPEDEAPIPMPPPPEPEPAPGRAHPDETQPASSTPVAPEGAEGLGLADEAPAAEARATEPIEDYDLLYVPDDDDEDADLPSVELEIPLADAGEDVMTDAAFADELISLVDSVFAESGDGGFELPDPAPQAGPQRKGNRIVVSPLFRDFSVDEMVAVIQGLKLLSAERGEVILREGQEGGSLYMLTAGRVRAFRKDVATGQQARVADLKEGAFFGEISILTGQPRSASIVALNRCELLELDRTTLDEITRTHPHVWDVLREFAGKRTPGRG